jgi:hypothetical protein
MELCEALINEVRNIIGNSEYSDKLKKKLIERLFPGNNDIKGQFQPKKNEIESACLYYRHDYGFMPEQEKEQLRREAKEWICAWQKVTEDMPRQK